MTNPSKPPDQKPNLSYFTLAGVAAQVGCLTLVIVLGAVFLGLWVDGLLNTKPWITIGLVLASIPVSIIVMVYVARFAASKIKADSEEQSKHP